MTLQFIDFEVFMFNWLCVIQDPINGTETAIVDNKRELLSYYEAHKSDIWIGYNIREYDSYILKAILCGFNPWEMNEWIITEHKKGYLFSSELNKFPLITYDLLQLGVRLKDLEGFQGHNIFETGVDFRIRRPLTEAEIAETIKYCTNDVDETRELFLKVKADFDVQMELINEFELPLKCISLTQTQLTAEILQASKTDYGDDFNITFQPYLGKIKKYRHVVDFFKQFKSSDRMSDQRKERIYENKLDTVIAGCPHTFGWGGAHGALLKYIGEGIYLHIDVHQYYPSLVEANDYFPRSVTKEGKRRYIMMKNESIRLKKFPELKNKRAGYKLCNNKMTGGMKDKYSKLYDPMNNNNICVGGQLAILLLIEMLEPVIAELVQSNTDGLIVKLHSINDYERIDDICYEWEQLTGVKLGFDPIITKIYQKDVNNYLFVNEDGDVERKGAYVKSLSPLDYDLAIVNRAMVEYMVNCTPPEVTVNSCTDLIEFQKIIKLSGKYESVEHNKISYSFKTYRVFASTDRRDGMVFKCKGVKKDKFANTPERCFIDQSNISGKSVPNKLDRQYYINLAKDRLIQYGLDEFKSQLEFRF